MRLKSSRLCVYCSVQTKDDDERDNRKQNLKPVWFYGGFQEKRPFKPFWRRVLENPPEPFSRRVLVTLPRTSGTVALSAWRGAVKVLNPSREGF